MMKMSKLTVSKFFALMLVFMLCFANIALANGPIIAPNEDNPVQVAISKILRLPIGTNTPDAKFEFHIEKISVNDDTSPEALASMPDLNDSNPIVHFTSTDKDTNAPVDNIMSIVKETGNIFDGANFPRAGIYIYEVTEVGFTNSAIDDAANLNESLTYSKALYTLRVYVANNADMTDTFVYAVGTIVTEKDNDDQTVGSKVDATPGGDQTTYFFSQMTFTNDYVKTNGPVDPGKPDPVTESTLNVSKTVTGDLADTGLYFNFDLTLTVPILVENVPPYYRAYVVEGNAVINDLANNAAPGLIGTDGGGSYIRIATSGITGISLKHGQRLVFVDTPVGTSYTVEEASAADYTPSVTVTTDFDDIVTIPGVVNTALNTGTRFVGERANSADFTNNRTSVVPTGININDLPFIGLIALPIVALIGFIAIKTRKRNRASYK